MHNSAYCTPTWLIAISYFFVPPRVSRFLSSSTPIYTGVRIYGRSYIWTSVYTDVHRFGRPYRWTSVYADVRTCGRPYIGASVYTAVRKHGCFHGLNLRNSGFRVQGFVIRNRKSRVLISCNEISCRVDGFSQLLSLQCRARV